VVEHSVCVPQFVRLEGMSCVYYLYRGVCILCMCVSMFFTSACVYGSVADHCMCSSQFVRPEGLSCV